MADSVVDYYSLLGVNRNASDEEIKEAWKKKIGENGNFNAGAAIGQNDPEIAEKAKLYNSAKAVLLSPESRKEYDNALRELDRQQRSPEGSTRTSGSIDNIVEGFMRNSGLEGFFSGEGFSTSPTSNTPSSRTPRTSKEPETKKEIEDVFIPENDIPLLAGLVEAYKTQREGVTDAAWKIHRVERDTRSSLPNQLYAVDLKDSNVSVRRSIVDWRPYGRDRNYVVTKERNPLKVDFEIPASQLLDEYYLIGEGRRRLRSEIGNIPSDYEKYLEALKSLAKKIANDEIDWESTKGIENELDTISSFGKYNRYTYREDDAYRDPGKEAARKIGLADFGKEIEQAKSCIEQVGGRTVEGQRKAPEGVNPQSSGENKG